MIFKQIYLTHRWDINQYYHSKIILNLGIIPMKGYSILPRAGVSSSDAV